MKFEHIVESDYHPTLRTEKIASMFDVKVEKKLRRTWNVDFPIEDFGPWSIGLIVGPSGAGKTTLAKRIFGEEAYHNGYDWGRTSLVNDFPTGLTVESITDALSRCGLSSPPHWMQSYGTLSNGEKFRAEIARAMSDEKGCIVIDEFTSVVDRDVAKAASVAVAKMVRRRSKQMVAVSCHYDIIDYLTPDWIYYVDTNTFTRGSLQRPRFQLDIVPCSEAAWTLFSKHHYLDGELRKGTTCHVGLVDGKPATFVGSFAFPHNHLKGFWREHRAVCLPDYQGLGLGIATSDAVAQNFLDIGHGYFSVTSHPAMISARARSPKWVLTTGKVRKAIVGENSRFNSSASNRLSRSFEYIGDGSKHKVTNKKAV